MQNRLLSFKSLLLISIITTSFAPRQLRAMDEATGCSYSAAFIAAALAGGISYAIKKFLSGTAAEQKISAPTHEQKNFAFWKQACDALPVDNERYAHTALKIEELTDVVSAYTDLEMQEGRFAQQATWLGQKPHDMHLYNNVFSPHVQKLIVDADSEVAFHGDLHGDIHALNNFIQNLNERNKMDGFKITSDKFYMLFLGDYTDRGYYGAEVWYTILRLKLANPDHVFMVRGNHEDELQNAKDGFLDELQSKFGTYNNLAFQGLQRLYNFLPLALYLGTGTSEETNYLLCCHGGLELGFDPKPLLEDPRKHAYTPILGEHNTLDRTSGVAKLWELTREEIQRTVPAPVLGACCMGKPMIWEMHNNTPLANQIGFMWSDFIVNPNDVIKFQNGRGWMYGKQLTHEVLALHSTVRHKLKGVFRAHQHGELDMMQRILNVDKLGHDNDAGVGKLWTDHAKIKEPHALWKGIVCTFSVAPALFGKHDDCPFDYDAFGILKTADKFDDWRLEMVRVNEHIDTSSTMPIASSSNAFASSPSATSDSNGLINI